MNDRLVYLGLLAGVVLAAVLIGKAVYDYERYVTLRDDGRIATATVNDLQPAHNRRGPEGRWTLRYSFETPDKKTINATVGLWRGQAERLRVGQKIDVVYAPDNPAMTALNADQAWVVVLYDERLLVPYLAGLIVLAWNALDRYRRSSS